VEIGSIIVGFIAGIIFTLLCCRKKPAGTLRIDRSNPNKDIYRFDVGDLDKLSTKRRIVLDIDPNAHFTQN
jgi:hypothetical protein